MSLLLNPETGNAVQRKEIVVRDVNFRMLVSGTWFFRSGLLPYPV